MSYTNAYVISYVTILSPTTAVEASDSFTLSNDNTTTITISGTLLASETITLYVYDPIASVAANSDVYNICPNSVLFTASSDPTIDGFLGCGRYQLVKTVTTNPVGISITQNKNTQTVLL